MGEEDLINDQKIANAAMADPTIQRIYVNGFVAGLSVTDVFIVLQTGATSVALVNMSHGVAKTLAASLSEVVSNYEKATGQKVLTIQETREKMDKAQNEIMGKKEAKVSKAKK